jgi:hypothetical protein
MGAEVVEVEEEEALLEVEEKEALQEVEEEVAPQPSSQWRLQYNKQPKEEED